MSFTPNLPQSGQTLGFTQNPIQSNFTVINNTIGVDHVAMTQVSTPLVNQGKHTFAHFVATTAGTTAANEVGLYCKNDAISPAAPRLFFREPSNGTEQRISGEVFKDIGVGATKVGGTAPLFGGFYIKWGRFAFTTTSTSPTFLAQSGSAFPTACFSVLVQPQAATTINTVPNVTGITAAGFTVSSIIAVPSQVIYFVAIGN